MGIKFDGTNVKNGSKVVANIKNGYQLTDGSSSGGRTLIKISDAAKKIGTSATGPSTALVWWFFAK